MKIYLKQCTQDLPITLEEAWDFFSSPKNLNTITPPELDFRIKSNVDGKMYAGQIIEYDILFLPGIRGLWLTEIKHVEELKQFVDEQRLGPYKFWYHRHTFEALDEKTCRIGDEIHYAVPGGPFAPIAHALIVRRKLDHIFNFRQKKLGELFPQ